MIKAAAGSFGLLGENFRYLALAPRKSANGILYRNCHACNIRIGENDLCYAQPSQARYETSYPTPSRLQNPRGCKLGVYRTTAPEGGGRFYQKSRLFLLGVVLVCLSKPIMGELLVRVTPTLYSEIFVIASANLYPFFSGPREAIALCLVSDAHEIFQG